jgi:hypothetical protein
MLSYPGINLGYTVRKLRSIPVLVVLFQYGAIRKRPGANAL